MFPPREDDPFIEGEFDNLFSHLFGEGVQEGYRWFAYLDGESLMLIDTKDYAIYEMDYTQVRHIPIGLWLEIEENQNVKPVPIPSDIAQMIIDEAIEKVEIADYSLTLFIMNERGFDVW